MVSFLHPTPPPHTHFIDADAQATQLCSIVNPPFQNPTSDLVTVGILSLLSESQGPRQWRMVMLTNNLHCGFTICLGAP